MAQVFPKWTNWVPLLLIFGGVSHVVGIIFVIWYWLSPSHLNVRYQPEQPVEFSHKLHAGELGLDCRYCHSAIEEGAHANIPSTQTCMNCHSQVKTESPKLALVRESFSENKPIPWVYIHKLPDYAYFNHSVHLAAGVGCFSCHGRIDQMEVVAQEKPLSMGWCLDCHREPENHLRPLSEITNMEYVHKMDFAHKTKQEKGINPPVHCSGCHR